MRLRLAILPPDKICKISARMAEKAGSFYPNWYIVDNKKFQPHITLFDVEVDMKKDAGKLKDILKSIVFTKRTDLEIDGFWAKRQDGSLGLRVKPSKKFKNQLKKLVKLFENNQIEIYLSRNFPHITLTKYKRRGNETIVAGKMRKLKEAFAVGKIVLTRKNKHSQFFKKDIVFQ